MIVEKGGYRAVYATSGAEVARAQSLRAISFGLPCGTDSDRFDDHCTHVLIEDIAAGDLVACFRIAEVSGRHVLSGYAAQFYDLRRLAARGGQMLELGRLCVDPARRDPDIIRLAWAALTRHVDRRAVRLLFGCTSFAGIDPAPYKNAFGLLGSRYLAPPGIAPGVKSADAIRFPSASTAPMATRSALSLMPPVLRFYLTLGARVGNHAVPDRTLNTLHVFTVLETDAIAPARQRLLRAI